MSVILGLCWVCSLMEKTVAGSWVWVILGLCWVCSLTEKMVAGGWVWVWVILGLC